MPQKLEGCSRMGILKVSNIALYIEAILISASGEALKERLEARLGEVVGRRVFEIGRQTLTNAVLESEPVV